MEKNRDFNQKLANLIRIIRLVNNYTQAYVAGQMNMSNTAYIDLEAGRTLLNPKRIEQLAAVFDIPFEDIMKLNTTHIVHVVLKRQGIDDRNDYEERIKRLEENNHEILQLLKVAIRRNTFNNC